MKKKNILNILVLSSALFLAACGSTNKESIYSSINTSVDDSLTSSSINSSTITPIEAINEYVQIVIEEDRILASSLFNINVSDYVLSSSNTDIVQVSKDGKSFVVVHGGYVEVTASAQGVVATVHLSLVNSESELNAISQKLQLIKTGYNISGYYYSKGVMTNVYKTYNQNYVYDNNNEIGYGIFKDGNVYKFKGNADGSFIGIGGSIGESTTWKRNLFKDFTVKNQYIALNENDYYIPYLAIGKETINPLAKSLLEQVELDSSTNFEYINLCIGDHGEILLSFIKNKSNGVLNKAAEFILADFGIAGIDDIEAWIKDAEIPTVQDNSTAALKAAFNKYINSNSYRIFGADITDSDHEIFYNYYSPTQYYEYFMNDAFGYINLDNKVFEYTADKNNHVVLGNEITGIKDYKEKIETLYTISDSIFNNVSYNSSQECYIYVPSEKDNALAKFLLHTCGYDTKGDNYLKNVEEIAFLISGDVIYVDINMGSAMAYGQIKFQIDSLDSVDMPQYIKPTVEDGEGKEYAGYYVGSGTMNTAQGKYETVESTLRLKTDMKGVFTFNNVSYDVTWSASDNASNQNQVDFTLSITSPTSKGESFEAVYLYKANKSKLQIKFNYDSSVVHISWNIYTLQAE